MEFGRSTAMEQRPNLRMEARLRTARKAMEEGSFGRAQSELLQAAKECACYPRRDQDAWHSPMFSFPACCGTMAQCGRMAKAHNPVSIFVPLQFPCSCGRLIRRCSNPLHIEMMDRFVQCMELTQHYIHAIHASIYLIKMNPALPVGYCRIVKIFRHLDAVLSESTHVSRICFALGMVSSMDQKTEFRPLMHAFVKQGLEDISWTPGPAAQSKYHRIFKQIAHKLGLLRVDPVKILPLEIICMIFSKLDTLDLFRCQLVSKVWRNVASGTQILWADVLLNRPGNPSRRELVNFLKAHGKIKAFTILETKNFGLDMGKLDIILMCLPELERLALVSTSSRLPSSWLIAENKPPVFSRHERLKKLTFVRVQPLGLRALDLILAKVASTLEDLTVIGTPGGVHMAFQGKVLEKLKLLRLDSLQHDDPENMRSRGRELYLMDIYLAAKNLQQLYLDRYDLLWNNEATSGGPPPSSVTWESLRVLVLGEGTRSFAGDEPPCLPRLSTELRVLDLVTTDKALYYNIFCTRHLPDPGEAAYVPHWPKLHTFRCRHRLWGIDVLRDAVAPAIKGGHLRVLDFGLGLNVNPAEVQDRRRYNGWTTMPARDLPFTFSEQVHTLGLSDFAWVDSPDCYSAFNPRPFLDWLDRFPRVHTVRVFPGSHANTGLLVTALIRRKVPTVVIAHKFAVPGAPLYDESYAGVAELAVQHGVDLRMVKQDFAPPTWPFELPVSD